MPYVRAYFTSSHLRLQIYDIYVFIHIDIFTIGICVAVQECVCAWLVDSLFMVSRVRPSKDMYRSIFANCWPPAGSTCCDSLEHKYFLEFTGVQYCAVCNLYLTKNIVKHHNTQQLLNGFPFYLLCSSTHANVKVIKSYIQKH